MSGLVLLLKKEDFMLVVRAVGHAEEKVVELVIPLPSKVRVWEA